MIRFLQTPGPIKKIVLGGLLTVICAAMAITLIPGGIGDSIGLGGLGQGVVAKVAGEPVTTLEVQREARQMVRQQQYENILQNADLSVPVFEQGAKDDILLGKLRNLIAGSALVTDSDVRREFEKQNTKVKFDYAVLR